MDPTWVCPADDKALLLAFALWTSLKYGSYVFPHRPASQRDLHLKGTCITKGPASQRDPHHRETCITKGPASQRDLHHKEAFNQ
eukprot:725083-Pelagomonas_calceolata.AAC.1